MVSGLYRVLIRVAVVAGLIAVSACTDGNSVRTASKVVDASGGVGTPCDEPGDRKTFEGEALMCDKIDKKAVWMLDHTMNGNETTKTKAIKGNFVSVPAAPSCPAKLDGLLTAEMVNVDDLATITPLGNVTPPGHTAPIDHQYVDPSREGKIPLFAPADGWVANLAVELISSDNGKTYKAIGVVVTFVVCAGFVLDLAATSGVELAPVLRSLLPEDLSKTNEQCKLGYYKIGHEGGPEGQCYYPGLNLPVKAGEQLLTMTALISRGARTRWALKLGPPITM